MCNACGFMCCALDTFDKCGCDGCDEPDCWTDDEDERDDDDWDPGLDCDCCAPRAAGFRCEAT